MRLVIGILFLLAIAAPSLARAANDGALTEGEIVTGVFNAIEKKILKDSLGRAAAVGVTETTRKDKKKNKNKKKKGKGGSDTLPPGLAKKNRLPPGLAMQLERGGSLPPGLAKRDLPADLESRLPRRPKGQERVIVGNDVVLVERATGIIIDVIKDVLAGH